MRRVSRALGVVFAAVLLGGCSSADTEEAKAYRLDYCTKLGLWQDARNSVDAFPANSGGSGTGGSRDGSIGVRGDAVVSAAGVLDGKGLDEDGGHVLDDTVAAVTGADLMAEGRIVSYCDHMGFETLVK
ncbi:hypothetical protein ACN9M0_20890 [Streptomyces sp. R-07]|uniref:hypothetical protein n=1 Tax=unclassified Streptomyces TaxID=2593676 RepID=UPI0034178B66